MSVCGSVRFPLKWVIQHVRAWRPEAPPAQRLVGHPDTQREWRKKTTAVHLAFDAADEYRPEAPPPPEIPAWKDGSIRIGIHTSIAGDISSSLEIAHGLGANALQIFSSSPRMWNRGGIRIAEAEAARFRARRKELGLGPLVIHDNYLINLASPNPVSAYSLRAGFSPGIRARDCSRRGLSGGPSRQRPGEHARGGRQPRSAQGLKQAARGLKLGDLKILLENTAGQGTSIGSRFEELRAILDASPDLPLGICIDTAHTFRGWLGSAHGGRPGAHLAGA